VSHGHCSTLGGVLPALMAAMVLAPLLNLPGVLHGLARICTELPGDLPGLAFSSLVLFSVADHSKSTPRAAAD